MAELIFVAAGYYFEDESARVTYGIDIDRSHYATPAHVQTMHRAMHACMAV